MEKYWVYWITGSARSGDRNAGFYEFDTFEEAMEEVADLQDKYFNDCQVVLIRGEQIPLLDSSRSQNDA